MKKIIVGIIAIVGAIGVVLGGIAVANKLINKDTITE